MKRDAAPRDTTSIIKSAKQVSIKVKPAAEARCLCFGSRQSNCSHDEGLIFIYLTVTVSVRDPQGELKSTVLPWLLTVTTKMAIAAPFVTLTVLELGST